MRTTNTPIKEGDWFINVNDRKPTPYRAEKNRFGYLGYRPGDYRPGAWFDWVPIRESDHKRIDIDGHKLKEIFCAAGLQDVERQAAAAYILTLDTPFALPLTHFIEAVQGLRSKDKVSAEDFIKLMHRRR